MLASVIPTVHKKSSEQRAIDDACRDFRVLKLALDMNRSYHEKPREAGYSLPTMPVNAAKWISVSKNLVRAQFLRCLDATSAPMYKDGNVYYVRSKHPVKGIVMSPRLGPYNRNTAQVMTDDQVVSTVDELTSGLRELDAEVGKGHFPEVNTLLHEYCKRPDITVFPFDESELGLNTQVMKDTFSKI